MHGGTIHAIALLSIWNDLPQEFIDKAIVISEETSILCCCSWQTLEHSV